MRTSNRLSGSLFRLCGAVIVSILIMAGCSSSTLSLGGRVIPHKTTASTNVSTSTAESSLRQQCLGTTGTLVINEEGLSGGQYVFGVTARFGLGNVCQPTTGTLSFAIERSNGSLLPIRNNPLEISYTAAHPYPPTGSDPEIEWENWCGIDPTKAHPFVIRASYGGAAGHLDLRRAVGVPVCLGSNTPSEVVKAF